MFVRICTKTSQLLQLSKTSVTRQLTSDYPQQTQRLFGTKEPSPVLATSSPSSLLTTTVGHQLNILEQLLPNAKKPKTEQIDVVRSMLNEDFTFSTPLAELSHSPALGAVYPTAQDINRLLLQPVQCAEIKEESQANILSFTETTRAITKKRKHQSQTHRSRSDRRPIERENLQQHSGLELLLLSCTESQTKESMKSIAELECAEALSDFEDKDSKEDHSHNSTVHHCLWRHMDYIPNDIYKILKLGSAFGRIKFGEKGKWVPLDPWVKWEKDLQLNCDKGTLTLPDNSGQMEFLKNLDKELLESCFREYTLPQFPFKQYYFNAFVSSSLQTGIKHPLPRQTAAIQIDQTTPLKNYNYATAVDYRTTPVEATSIKQFMLQWYPKANVIMVPLYALPENHFGFHSDILNIVEGSDVKTVRMGMPRVVCFQSNNGQIKLEFITGTQTLPTAPPLFQVQGYSMNYTVQLNYRHCVYPVYEWRTKEGNTVQPILEPEINFHSCALVAREVLREEDQIMNKYNIGESSTVLPHSSFEQLLTESSMEKPMDRPGLRHLWDRRTNRSFQPGAVFYDRNHASFDGVMVSFMRSISYTPQGATCVVFKRDPFFRDNIVFTGEGKEGIPQKMTSGNRALALACYSSIPVRVLIHYSCHTDLNLRRDAKTGLFVDPISGLLGKLYLYGLLHINGVTAQYVQQCRVWKFHFTQLPLAAPVAVKFHPDVLVSVPEKEAIDLLIQS